MGSIKIPFFRIWYSSAFVILFIITLVLTLISPGDLIYQLIRASKLRDVASLAGVYVLAALVCLFIWASRIYTNRAALRDIPKAYVPVEPGEVPRKVRRMIERQWRRSALVAWDSRPRDVAEEISHEHDVDGKRRRLFHHRRSHAKNATIISPSTAAEAWGHIENPGWSAPGDSNSTDGQSVQYWAVIVELPNLLEAKAVSLAPSIMEGHEDEVGQQPDPRLLALLQRPAGMGLRDYVEYLLSIGTLSPSTKVQDFIDDYEFARFSTRALVSEQFEQLMSNFATVLSLMSLDISRLSPLIEDLGSEIDLSQRYIANSEEDNSTSPHRASMESDLSGSVRRHVSLRRSDSPSALSHSSSVLIHSPRLSFSDT
jgi:hypothetical protein